MIGSFAISSVPISYGGAINVSITTNYTYLELRDTTPGVSVSFSHSHLVSSLHAVNQSSVVKIGSTIPVTGVSLHLVDQVVSAFSDFTYNTSLSNLNVLSSTVGVSGGSLFSVDSTWITLPENAVSIYSGLVVPVSQTHLDTQSQSPTVTTGSLHHDDVSNLVLFQTTPLVTGGSFHSIESSALFTLGHLPSVYSSSATVTSLSYLDVTSGLVSVRGGSLHVGPTTYMNLVGSEVSAKTGSLFVANTVYASIVAGNAVTTGAARVDTGGGYLGVFGIPLASIVTGARLPITESSLHLVNNQTDVYTSISMDIGNSYLHTLSGSITVLLEVTSGRIFGRNNTTNIRNLESLPQIVRRSFPNTFSSTNVRIMRASVLEIPRNYRWSSK